MPVKDGVPTGAWTAVKPFPSLCKCMRYSYAISGCWKHY